MYFRFALLCAIAIPVPVAAQSGGDVQISNVTMFRLDLIGGAGEDPASNWYRISGGGQILHKTDKTTGSDQFQLSDGGDVEFSEVEVVGPFVSGGSRAELLKWLNRIASETRNREDDLIDVSLTFLNRRELPLTGMQFFEVIPTFYAPPSVRAGDDSLLEERFSFKPERVEMGMACPSGPPVVLRRLVQEWLLDLAAVVGDEDPKQQPDPASVDFQIDATEVVLASEIENVITGRSFKFEIDGKAVALTACDPGPFRAELKDATMGNRKSNFKTFTVTKPHFDTWRVEKYYERGDLTLKNLFEAFARGERKTNPSDTGSLIYLDRDGSEARRVNFFGYSPLHYEVVGEDDDNDNAADPSPSDEPAIEVMEFSVMRCEYH